MTATTATLPHHLASRTWASMIRLVAILAVLVALAIGSFAVGRTTADEGGAKASVVPAASPAPAAPASCGHTAHTPPC